MDKGLLGPPGPIRDLVATNIVNGEHFNLTFTLPGEDLNTGTVKEFRIFFATNRTDLEGLSPSSNVSQISEEMLSCDCSLESLPALSRLNLRLNSNMFESETEYSFRVLAVDQGDKTSASNFVTLAPTFNVGTEPTPTPTPSPTNVPDNSGISRGVDAFLLMFSLNLIYTKL